MSKEREKLSLVLYKEEQVVQMWPPKMIPVRWFYALGRVEKDEDLFRLRERIGEWCGVEKPESLHMCVHEIEKGEKEGLIIGVQLGGITWLGPRVTFPEPAIIKEKVAVMKPEAQAEKLE